MKTVQTQSNVAQASNPATLLRAATGCVYGRDRGTLFCDLIIDAREHRTTFDSAAELENFIRAAGHAGIPIHFQKELSRFFTAAIIASGILLTLLYLFYSS